MNINTFTGTVTEYHTLRTQIQTEWAHEMKIQVLSTPSHHRLRLFGKDTLTKIGMIDTCRERRLYA